MTKILFFMFLHIRCNISSRNFYSTYICTQTIIIRYKSAAYVPNKLTFDVGLLSFSLDARKMDLIYKICKGQNFHVIFVRITINTDSIILT